MGFTAVRITSRLADVDQWHGKDGAPTMCHVSVATLGLN